MSATVSLEPLRIGDAGDIRQCGLPMADNQSLTAIRNEIRRLLDFDGLQTWVARIGDDKTLQAVVKIQTLDSISRRAEIKVQPNEYGLLPGVLKALIEKAFWEHNLYRLEIAIPAEADNDLRTIRQIGFVEEGKLRCSQINPETQRHYDVLIFSLLRPEYADCGTAFVPFRLGVFAVTGNALMLTETSFVRYGDQFNPGYQQECAEMAGILTENGNLAERDYFSEYLNSYSSIVHSNAPEPVKQAASQIQAYFAGKMPKFDLPLDLSKGSEFQVRVWQALAAIPYGTTWTYEELAYELAPGNWQTARNMARAIGSACGANPLPLILPCHRVIGKDGRLVGFSGGLDIKEFLLDHEIMGMNH